MVKLSRKPSTQGSSSAMKFRPIDTCRSLAKGTKPLAEAASVGHVLTMMLIHFCRKVLYGIDLPLKIGIYIVGTLFLSLLGDFGSESKSYFSRSDNFVNLFFVKFSWGWTLFAVAPFMIMSGIVTSCGNKNQLKAQIIRIILATSVWYFVTTFFVALENGSGMCTVTKFGSKHDCIENGFRWKGFDISGHTFLLTFANLFIIEEGKSYLGWERIKDMLRLEEHKRLSTEIAESGDGQTSSTSLSKLSLDEFMHLRSSYAKFTPYVRAMFCTLAAVVTLWDFMLICTILYFHIMIEKVVASCLAVLFWFFLYRWLYTTGLSDLLRTPGNEGPFKYVTYKAKSDKSCGKDSCGRGRTSDKRPTRGDDIPKFMGMPLYGLTKQNTIEVEEQALPSKPVSEAAVIGSLKGSRSRSTSRIGFPRNTSKSSLNLRYL